MKPENCSKVRAARAARLLFAHSTNQILNLYCFRYRSRFNKKCTRSYAHVSCFRLKAKLCHTLDK